jgi:hypothetical protein
MSRKLKFIWIDDDAGREMSAINLGKQLDVECYFINVKPVDVDYMLKVDQIKPDFILIDHNLTDIGTGKIKKGSTVAALIREMHPTIAIACITGQESKSIDSQQRLSYETVFSYDDIKDHYLSMYSIAESYRKLKTNQPKDTSELFNLMKVPNEDLKKLENICPHEIKENFNDPGIFANISQWIRNVLVERPGFLYDRLWAATLLGLNESGFKKVEILFLSARYNGPFADQSKERWWKADLLKILSQKVPTFGLPWERGRLLLPKLTARHFSKDYYSNDEEEYPEVVAFLDETTSVRQQMKLKYTVPHPRYEKLLFFEEIRMMKAD